MMAWAYFTMPSPEELQQQREEQALQDSLSAIELESEQQTTQQEPGQESESITGTTPLEETAPTAPVLGIFQPEGVTDTTYTIVETSKYEAVFTNLGAGPSFYELKEYDTGDQTPVQMIGDTTRSAYYLGFLSSQNYNIETDQILFRQITDRDEIRLNGNASDQLQYALELADGGRIVYTYTFHAERHAIDLDIQVEGLSDQIIGNVVDFGWKPRINFTEADRMQDAQYSSAYIYAGGVLENFTVTGPGSNDITVNGTIDWVSTKTKFFTQIIKPLSGTISAHMEGELNGPNDDPATIHHYQTSIQSSIPDDGHLQYELYLGPLDYYELQTFDDHAFDMVDISYAWMRWFADPLVRWVIIPYFTFASDYITNFGVLIILFGVLIKLVLAPLTKKSFESMAAMRELQPQMKELQEKYKDNPKKQQEETIKLYKKAKVNPLGGCLPMLLQFPILITLWMYFQSSILLRHEPFLWAADLASPDYILDLPFAIPFMGDQIAGFVLLMTAAMFVQTKISGGMSSGSAPSGAPNMKAFTYIMPVMLLFIFNNFAAGLSLYYLVYNVMSIGQQFLINKNINIDLNGDDEKKNKRRPKKRK